MSIQAVQNKVHAFYHNRMVQDWRGKHLIRGGIPDKHAIQLVSNDYLDIANHPAIREAQRDALLHTENSMMMSAVFLQEGNPQAELEDRFAEYLLAESVILCQSGYSANTGLIQTLVQDTTIPVYIDMLAHMSLWDGVLLGGAKAYAFRHNDIEHLLSQIKKFGPGLVVVDSVYSTNGSVCPLRELVEAISNTECILLVDESHSLGTHGPEGRGMVADLNLTDKVTFRTASLAKAFSGRAGLITCSREFTEYFKFTSKPTIFSSSLLPHEIAGLKKTMQLIKAADERRSLLRYHSAHIREQLIKLGYNLNDSQSQIVSLESGSEWNTIQLRDALEKRGIFGSIFAAPATPKNRALVRLSLNAGLSELQIQRIVKVCRDIRDEIKLDEWPSTRRLARTQRAAHAMAS